MRSIMVGFVLLIGFTGWGGAVWAQAPQPGQFAAVGLSYNQGAKPAMAATGLLAIPAGKDTYWYTMLDALPSTTKPFTVTNQFSTGLARRIATVGNTSVFMPTTAGVAWNGTNTGWSWSTGLVAVRPWHGVYLMPNVRMIKSSVNEHTNYQVVGGVMVGFGLGK